MEDFCKELSQFLTPFEMIFPRQSTQKSTNVFAVEEDISSTQPLIEVGNLFVCVCVGGGGMFMTAG